MQDTSPIRSLRGFLSYVLILLQLGGLWWLTREFELEQAFRLERIYPIAIAAVAIGPWLRLSWRPWVLPLSFLAGSIALLGPDTMSGMGVWSSWLPVLILWMCCAILIGTAHLPVRRPIKITLLLVEAVLLGLVISGHWQWGPLSAILPLVGTMFMFRLILYVRELPLEKNRIHPGHRIGYFLMLPNLVFPLFPVVDYKLFSNSFLKGDPWAIQQRGVRRILRGVLHLLVYRALYHWIEIPPEEVSNHLNLLQHVAASFGFALRLSGMLHTAVGFLGLFGYELPEIFFNYVMATNFSELWRRLNIYWKDFAVKVIYYPLYFRIKKIGQTPAMMLSTMVAFIISWALHSYQFFWIRGEFPVRFVDGVFWILFGIVVSLNVLYQLKTSKKPRRKPAQHLWNDMLRAARMVAMFMFMATLWNMWNSESLTAWFHTLEAGIRGANPTWRFWLAGAACWVLAGIVLWINRQQVIRRLDRRLPMFPNAAWGLILIAGLASLSWKPAEHHLSALLGRDAGLVLKDELNRGDEWEREKGYYDGVLGRQTDLTSAVWENEKDKPQGWRRFRKTPASQETYNLLEKSIKPNSEIQFKGKKFTSNRWGLRDKDYEQKPAPGTFRIAILGGSYEMGSGVADHAVFENVFEELLNKRLAEDLGVHFEVLNFAVSGYQIIQHVYQVDSTVMDFEPDLLLYFGHLADQQRAVGSVARLVIDKIDLHYAYLDNLVDKLGLRHADEAAMRREMPAHGDSIVMWGYRHIVEKCAAQDVRAAWVYLPTLSKADMRNNNYKPMAKLARKSGFETTIDMTGAYGPNTIEDLQISPFDNHPNAQGHKLLGKRLFKELRPLLKAWLAESND